MKAEDLTYIPCDPRTCVTKRRPDLEGEPNASLVAFKAVYRLPVCDCISKDTVREALTLLESVRKKHIQRKSTLNPPRSPSDPLPPFRTWSLGFEDEEGKVTAEQMKRVIHFCFHPDPKINPDRWYAARGFSRDLVKRMWRRMVDLVPDTYNPKEHRWNTEREPGPDPDCLMCGGKGSKTMRKLDSIHYHYWPCPCTGEK